MKCSPKIWKKFTAKEKEVWTELHLAFGLPAYFAEGWRCAKDAKKREVTAHNMACQAIWTLNDHGIIL